MYFCAQNDSFKCKNVWLSANSYLKMVNKYVNSCNNICFYTEMC